jgi:hypothetical protein
MLNMMRLFQAMTRCQVELRSAREPAKGDKVIGLFWLLGLEF